MVQFLVNNGLLGVGIISAVFAFIAPLISKILIDQDRMDSLKEEMEEIKDKFDEAQEDDDDEKFQKYQSRMMELSMEQMKMSMKPMAVTLLIALPVFIWLLPGLYGVSAVTLTDGSGTLTHGGSDIPLEISTNSDPVLKIGEQSVAGTASGKEVTFGGEVVEAAGFRFQPESFNTETGELKMKRVILSLPFSLPFFGSHFSWLGTYIIFAMPLSIVFRKLLGL